MTKGGNLLSAQNGKRQFLGNVFPAEIEEIKKIRQRRGLDTANLNGSPSVELGLGGLALSGGGIRAASFCLGVVQGLDKLPELIWGSILKLI